MAISSPQIPHLERVDWINFRQIIPWKQSEHVAVIAQTGDGKSVLLRALAWERDWVAWLSTKKRDEEYDRNIRLGYKRINKWPPDKPPREQQYQRLMVWPHFKNLMDIYKAGPFYKKILEDVYRDEGWTVVLDDLFFLSEKLKLREEITALEYQVRSLGVTLIKAMQRPRKIPLECWDQAAHIFLRPLNNYQDLLSMRAVVGEDAKTLQAWFRNIREHEWLYISVRNQIPPCIIKPPLERIK